MFRWMRTLVGAALFASIILASLSAQVTTPVLLAPVPVQQFFDNNGLPCIGCQLFTYAAGTTTPLSAYTGPTGATPLPNPIILNARGEPQTGGASSEIWLLANTSYKFVLALATDTNPPTSPVWTADNIIGGAGAYGATGIMYPAPGQSASPTVPWITITPSGSPVSCPNTTTQCYNEFLAAAKAGGWQAVIAGGGMWNGAGIQPAPLYATSPLIVPSGALFMPVHQQFAAYITADDGYTMDSCEVCTFVGPQLIIWTDPVTGGSGGSAIHIKGVNVTPVDSVLGVSLAHYYFGAAVKIATAKGSYTGQAYPVVHMDQTNGSFGNGTLEFSGDICAGCDGTGNIYAANGIGIDTPTSNVKGFVFNHIIAAMIHGQSGAGILEGISGCGSYQAALGANIYDIAEVAPWANTGGGIDICGHGDKISIETDPNQCGQAATPCTEAAYAVKFETGATGNVFSIATLGTVTAPLIDNAAMGFPNNGGTLNGLPIVAGVQANAVNTNWVSYTGCPIVMTAGQPLARLTVGGTVSSCTVTLPPNPPPAFVTSLATNHAVTSLTVETSDGSSIDNYPSSLTAYEQAQWIYGAATTSWQRLQ